MKKKKILRLEISCVKKNIPIYKYFVSCLIVIFNFFNIDKFIFIKIVNKYEMLLFNFKYRKKYSLTNFLVFPINCIFHNNKYIGDIIICNDIIFNESIFKKKNILYYWYEIIIHSVLHLFGYNHISLKDYLIMKKIENKILKRLKK